MPIADLADITNPETGETMGGKSRKTGAVSKSLIDKIKAGGKLGAAKPASSPAPTPSNKPITVGNDPFGLFQ